MEALFETASFAFLKRVLSLGQSFFDLLHLALDMEEAMEYHPKVCKCSVVMDPEQFSYITIFFLMWRVNLNVLHILSSSGFNFIMTHFNTWMCSADSFFVQTKRASCTGGHLTPWVCNWLQYTTSYLIVLSGMLCTQWLKIAHLSTMPCLWV